MAGCPYTDIFGKVGEGVHSYRIANIAILDVIFTCIVAFFIHVIFSRNFFYVLAGLFALGIILHRLFCVRTTVDKLLFNY